MRRRPPLLLLLPLRSSRRRRRSPTRESRPRPPSESTFSHARLRSSMHSGFSADEELTSVPTSLLPSASLVPEAAEEEKKTE